jgi:flagellar protein FliS
MRPNPYLRDSVETASPGRLLVMLYDRLALDLDRASAACEGGDVERAHDALVHAQDVVAELQGSLDIGAWPAASRLADVYDYILGELCAANVTKDPRRVETCRRVLAPLHAAWREAAGIVEPPAALRLGA